MFIESKKKTKHNFLKVSKIPFAHTLKKKIDFPPSKLKVVPNNFLPLLFGVSKRMDGYGH